MERKLTNNAAESEKSIERYLARQCAARGWLCLKYATGLGGIGGYPDRMISSGADRIAWVEVKSKGRTPSPLQCARIAQLRAFGFQVFIAASRTDVDAILNTLQTPPARPL